MDTGATLVLNDHLLQVAVGGLILVRALANAE